MLIFEFTDHLQTHCKVGDSSGVYAALSTDDDVSWVIKPLADVIKPLPIALPHETDLKNFGTLGKHLNRSCRDPDRLKKHS